MSALAEMPATSVPDVATEASGIADRATWREAVLVSLLVQAACIGVMFLGDRLYPTRLDFVRENRFSGSIDNLPGYYAEYAAHQAKFGKKPMIGLALGGDLAWLRPLVRWDSFWFLSVAERGYVVDPQLPVQQNIAFFPLYPLLIRGLSLSGMPQPLAAVLLSNLATLLTAGLLFHLAARQFGLSSARWVLWLWLGYPTALFGCAAYSDSLLALASVLALRCLTSGQPFRLSVASGLATACRAPGLSLAALLIPGVFSQSWWRYLLALPFSVAGIAGYFAWLGWQFGDPLLYPKVIRSWRATDNLHPIRLIRSLLAGVFNAVAILVQGGELLFIRAIQIADPLLLVWTLAWVPAVRRLGWGPLLYTLAAVGLAVSAGGLTSFARYSWAILPVFLVAGDSLARSGWRWPVLAAAIALQWWLAFLFGGGWEVI